MADGWADVFPDLGGDPVVGRAADYYVGAAWVERESARMSVAADSARTLPDADAWDGVTGATAVALRSSAGDLQRLVEGVNPAFEACRSVLEAHAEALAELQADADRALERTLERNVGLRAARELHADRCAELGAVDAELRPLRWSRADPLTELQLAHLEHRRGRLAAGLASAEVRLELAEAELIASRSEYEALAARERDLVAATVTGLIGAPVFDSGAVIDVIEGVTAAIGVVASGVLGALDRAAGAGHVVGGVVGDVVGTVLGGLFGDEVGDGAELVVDVLAGSAEERAVSETAAAADQLLDQVGDALLGLLWCAGRLTGSPPASGDPGGTFTREHRGLLPSAPGESEGAALVAAALLATADTNRIAADEFGLVTAGPNRYVVVLPGVTDLTRAEPGLNPHNRTPRDTDVNAWPSFPTAGTADNRYAQLVAGALAAAGVPPGAELAIVGHSFGADTALDLAADPSFNGNAYRVTHVVAAGYDSGSQLEQVPLETEVLVLQNTHDVPVLVEHAAHPAATALDVIDDGLNRIERGDLAGGRARVAAGVDMLGTERTDPDVTEPGVHVRVPGHVQVVFDGGHAGAGHAQQNYVDYLAGATVAAGPAAGFLARLTARGYRPGELVAIDISTPELR